MSLPAALRDVQIDEVALDGIIGSYFRALDEREPGLGTLMQARAAEDEEFAQDCKQAASDALLLSTMAATLRDDDEFQALIAASWEFDDPFFERMRADLLDEGLSTARETAAPDDELWRSIQGRSEAFRAARGLAQLPQAQAQAA